MSFAGEFDDIYRYAISPKLKEYGHMSMQADELSGTERILKQTIQQMAQADVIIANLYRRHPNVFYELEIAHSLGRPVILISSKSDDTLARAAESSVLSERLDCQ